jgi:hypothetical protein
MTFNAFIFRHIVIDAAATECVDRVIRFSHRHAIEDYAYGCFREALRTTFGGHKKKIERGTDSEF